MISRGIVYAGRKEYATTGTGHTVYKAENILSGSIFGDPQDENINISAARNRYLMEFIDILPAKLWAVAMIANCANAVSFDPRKTAFTDTATIFAAKSAYSAVPFDLIFISRIYRYYYALSCRMSYLNAYRSHIYPTNLRLMPWNADLEKVTASLEALRPDLVSACENHFKTEAATFAALDKLPLRTFKEVFKDHAKSKGTKVEWSESLLKGTDNLELSANISAITTGESWKIQLSNYMFDWVAIPSEACASGLALALSARSGTSKRSVDREALLNMPIPHDDATREAFEGVLKEFKEKDHAKAMEAVVDQIDALIGPVLGLSAEDIAYVKAEMLEDPFLKNIIPRWPATETRIHGYRTGLDSSERYN